MKITMDGKYAYRKDPYTQVRILCVDRNDPAHPILSMANDGEVEFHSPTGAAPHCPDYDLVPLKEGLPDLWLVMYEDGEVVAFEDEAVAKAWVKDFSINPKLHKYIPAPDQTS